MTPRRAQLPHRPERANTRSQSRNTKTPLAFGEQMKIARSKKANVLTCTGCNTVLKTVTYTMWGTKRWDAKAGFYEEDDSPGNTDIEFSCPKCSAELDAEAIIGF
jgi:hypothetical protein